MTCGALEGGAALLALSSWACGPAGGSTSAHAQDPVGGAPSDETHATSDDAHPPRPIGDGSYWLERRRVVSRPSEPAFPDHPETVSVIPIIRPKDPATGSAAAGDIDASGCDLTKLRRTFRLEKREFLLGEPIIVEFRVENDGPGTWYESYGWQARFTGRPDWVRLELRDREGRRAPDPHAVFGGASVRGMRASRGVTQTASGLPGGDGPATVWLPAQSWCAVTEPGAYALICCCVRDCRVWVGPADGLPEQGDAEVRKSRIDALVDAARTASAAEIDLDLVDSATFAIKIRAGSPQECDTMRAAYRAQLPGRDFQEQRFAARRESAIVGAIALAMQDEWLPTVRELAPRGGEASLDWAKALAMRGSDAALRCLDSYPSTRALPLQALAWVRPDRLPDVLPRLVAALDATAELERDTAAATLASLAAGVRRAAKIPDPGNIAHLPPAEAASHWREWWRANREAITAYYREGAPAGR